MTTATPQQMEALQAAGRDVAVWSRSVADWQIDDIRAVVADWQTTEQKAWGRDLLTNAQIVLKALGQIASAVEISIMKIEVERDIAKLNPARPPQETGKTGGRGKKKGVAPEAKPLRADTKSKLRAAYDDVSDTKFDAIAEAHREAQVELSRVAVKELGAVSQDYLDAAVKAVKHGQAPSLLAWHKTRQAQESGTDMVAKMRLATQPREPREIYLGTLAQLQAVLAQTDIIICQGRTFEALPQDAVNSGALLDIDAIANPKIIQEGEPRQ